MERTPTEQDKIAFLEKTFKAITTIETKRQEAIKVAENLSRIEEGELKKATEKIFIPLIKENPYEADKLFEKASKHHKDMREVVDKFLKNQLFLQDLITIYAK